jgi:hypothetical protein
MTLTAPLKNLMARNFVEGVFAWRWMTAAAVPITIVVKIDAMTDAMTSIGMTVTDIAGIAQGRHVEEIMTIVVHPGLHLPGGRMIEGLQGMIKTEDVTKENATIRKIAMKIGQDTQTEKDGLVEGLLR